MKELAHREAYGKALASYGEKDTRIIVLDADTSSSTLTNYFAEKFPERFINVGIAEPCMVDVAVGLSLCGKVPFVNAFAALLALRAIEQIRTCVCYARTNVKIVAGYAGVSDFKDGPTHHSISDIAIMRSLPEMRVIVPADSLEVISWIPVIAQNEGPVYFRISRASTISVHHKEVSVQFGKGEILRDGGDVTIVACGSMVGVSMIAAEKLASEKIQAKVINMSSIKPIDEAILRQAAEETGAIVSAEEHTIKGGLGGAITEVLSENIPVPVIRTGIKDTFTTTAFNPEIIMENYGMGVEDIISNVKLALSLKKKTKA